MLSLSFISASILLLFSISSNTASATSVTRHSTSNMRKYYARHHSLGEDYQFNPREWQSVNVTDLSYKYDHSSPSKRSPKTSNQSGKDGNGPILHMFDKAWKGLKGKGKAEDVKITWYTGHDLLNPSCWSNTHWAPTDDSFACALTLQGWNSRPECFKFLELCNGPAKCVFVRVVDSCAGCAPGSKHVDLTKGAFSQLANLDEGVLDVQMRQATDPDAWFEDLWGPKQ